MASRPERPTSTTPTSPLWEDPTRPAYPEPLPGSGHVGTVVVGGGLTGLTTALLLARAGREVALLEARRIGSGTTGASSAKVSLVQGTKLSQIHSGYPLRIARAYTEANREGQAWLREFCELHDVPFATRPAGTYAATDGELHAVREEYDALQAVGLPVRWSDALDVPFDVRGAVVLDDQFQLDPTDVVHRLAEELRTHGGSVHEGRRVRTVDRERELVAVQLADGSTLTCDRLVIATGAPSLSGWLWAAKTTSHRSYVIALEGARPVPGMFISAGEPVRSVRTAAPTADVLLVGGAGHEVGRTRSEAARLDELRGWAHEHFPGAVETHAWAAQDYATADGLPVFGAIPGTQDRIHLASGYDKWGMTNAVAAARAISADMLGRPPSWTEGLQRRPVSLRGIANLARQGLFVSAVQARGLLGAQLRALPADVQEGAGAVGRSGLRPAAVSRVDGSDCALSAVCTHMGGILRWNDLEQSWDCPLHGSRFDAEGEVIEGPASKPLARLDPDDHQPAGSGRPSA